MPLLRRLLEGAARWYAAFSFQGVPEHGFTSDAFVVAAVTQPIPVTYFWLPFRNWRLTALVISVASVAIYLVVFFLIFLFRDGIILGVILTRLLVFILSKVGIGQGDARLGSIVANLIDHLVCKIPLSTV